MEITESLYFGKRADKRHIPNEIATKIFEKYKMGRGLWTIEKEYHISRTKLRRLLKQNKISLRTYKEAELCKIKDYTYFINEKFFNNIENWEEKQAWVLGWLASDGNNSKDYYSLKIALQERDKCILDIMKQLLEYEGPLSFIKTKGNRQNQYCLSIGNTYLCHVLKNLGIIASKSLVYKFPMFLRNHKMLRHYMRGYFEGDGHISNRKTYKGIHWEVLGTQSFLTEYCELLIKNTDVSCLKLGPKDKKNKIYILRVHNLSDLYKIYKFFYQNSRFVLMRKKEAFETWFKSAQSPQVRSLEMF